MSLLDICQIQDFVIRNNSTLDMSDCFENNLISINNTFYISFKIYFKEDFNGIILKDYIYFKYYTISSLNYYIRAYPIKQLKTNVKENILKGNYVIVEGEYTIEKQDNHQPYNYDYLSDEDILTSTYSVDTFDSNFHLKKMIPFIKLQNEYGEKEKINCYEGEEKYVYLKSENQSDKINLMIKNNEYSNDIGLFLNSESGTTFTCYLPEDVGHGYTFKLYDGSTAAITTTFNEELNNDGYYYAVLNIPSNIILNSNSKNDIRLAIYRDTQLLWNSNCLQMHETYLNAIRYTVVKSLNNFFVTNDSSSKNILLEIDTTIKSGFCWEVLLTSIDHSAFAQPISITNLHFNTENKTILLKKIINKDYEGNLISFKGEATFALVIRNSQREVIHTYNFTCEELLKENNILNIEPYGVSIGELSTSTKNNPKFEVNYDTYFNKRVDIFPVGAIYLSMTNENPEKYFVGVWKRCGEGKFPLGISDEENMSYANKGAKKDTYQYTIQSKNLPPHRHYPANRNTKSLESNSSDNTGYPYFMTMAYSGRTYSERIGISNNNNGTHYIFAGKKPTTAGMTHDGVSTHASQCTNLTDYRYGEGTGFDSNGKSIAGVAQPIDILPPYFTCYMWQRID